MSADGGWGRSYAQHKEAQRAAGRRLANDPEARERSRRYVSRLAAACKQTKGNIKAAGLLIAEWEEAEERARNSPVRTLALADSGDPEAFEYEQEDAQ